MELGANAPLIVYEDADLETALNAAVPTKFANAGQVCLTPDRFYVHESLHGAFAEGFAARAIGWGFDMTKVSGDSRLLAAAAGASVARFRQLAGQIAAKAEKGAY